MTPPKFSRTDLSLWCQPKGRPFFFFSLPCYCCRNLCPHVTVAAPPPPPLIFFCPPFSVKRLLVLPSPNPSIVPILRFGCSGPLTTRVCVVDPRLLPCKTLPLFLPFLLFCLVSLPLWSASRSTGLVQRLIPLPWSCRSFNVSFHKSSLPQVNLDGVHSEAALLQAKR